MQRGEVARTFDGIDLKRERRRGAATALFSLPQRRSFFAAWPALGESWEISLDPDAAPIFDGLVHDYRMGEGIAKPGYLGARRAPLGRPMPAFGFADARVPWLAGKQGDEVVVVHLDVRRRIAALRVAGAEPARGRAAPGLAWAGPRTSGGCRPATRSMSSTRRAGCVWPGTRCPGRCASLQATDDAVWALVGERGARGPLHASRRPGGCVAARGRRGRAVAALCGGRRPQLLVLRADPPALLLLDAAGRAAHLAVAAGDGVRWGRLVARPAGEASAPARDGLRPSSSASPSAAPMLCSSTSAGAAALPAAAAASANCRPSAPAGCAFDTPALQRAAQPTPRRSCRPSVARPGG